MSSRFNEASSTVSIDSAKATRASIEYLKNISSANWFFPEWGGVRARTWSRHSDAQVRPALEGRRLRSFAQAVAAIGKARYAGTPSSIRANPPVPEPWSYTTKSHLSMYFDVFTTSRTP